VSAWTDFDTPPDEAPAAGMMWKWNTVLEWWEQVGDPSYTPPEPVPASTVPRPLLPAGWEWGLDGDGNWQAMDKRPKAGKTGVIEWDANGNPLNANNPTDFTRNPDGSYKNPADTTPAALPMVPAAPVNPRAIKSTNYKPPVVKRTMPNLWMPFSIRNGTNTGWKNKAGKKAI